MHTSICHASDHRPGAAHVAAYVPAMLLLHSMCGILHHRLAGLLLALQSRRDMHDSKDGLKEFAEMPFFSRARTTGQMSEIVDKLKANLRQARSPLLYAAISCQAATCVLNGSCSACLLFCPARWFWNLQLNLVT